jgi:hypothetical protein
MSADWTSLGGRIWENTQIYDGTNQIQRVVIAKGCSDRNSRSDRGVARAQGSADPSVLRRYFGAMRSHDVSVTRHRRGYAGLQYRAVCHVAAEAIESLNSSTAQGSGKMIR